jgi:hypothetical protein
MTKGMRPHFLRNTLAVALSFYVYSYVFVLVSRPLYDAFLFNRGFTVYGSGIYEFSAENVLFLAPYLLACIVVGIILGFTLDAQKPVYWALAACFAIDIANAAPYVLWAALRGQYEHEEPIVHTLERAVPIFIAPFIYVVGTCLIILYVRARLRKGT